MICIYCSTDTAADGFDREHVLPQGLGTFKQAPVLHSSVCAKCNRYFGQSLDLTLLRGSDEGLQRFLIGARPVGGISKFRYDHVTIRHAMPDDYQGALVRLKPDPHSADRIRGEYPDQIGFSKRDGEGFIWLYAHELDRAFLDAHTEIDLAGEVRIYAEDRELIISRLRALGIHPSNWRPLRSSVRDGEEATVVIESEISRGICRAIAKIAFNYLAFTHGAEFVRAGSFDDIRRFVRFDEGPSEFVNYDSEEIVALEGDRGRPAVHMLCTEPSVEDEAILGQVQLFGGIRYQVLLALEVPPDFSPSGHMFNPATRTITAMAYRPQARPAL